MQEVVVKVKYFLAIATLPDGSWPAALDFQNPLGYGRLAVAQLAAIADDSRFAVKHYTHC